MANRIHSYGSCPLWNVSVGVRICYQICSSRSGSGAMRLQSFADFQGSGWKLANFLQWPSNVVTALANGARQGVSQAGSLSVFSLPYLALSLPWLMKLGGHTASFMGAQKEARPACQDPPVSYTHLTLPTKRIV